MNKEFLNFVSPDDVETQVLSWGSFNWLNAPKVTGTKNMALGLGRIKPGDGHSKHNHPGSEEFIYLLSGKCEQMVEVNGVVKKKVMTAGEMVYIPEGAYHSTFNIGDEDLVFLACYQYAGPEEFLAKEATILPPKNKR